MTEATRSQDRKPTEVRKKILVVDDSRSVQQAMGASLAAEFEVVFADDGRDALKAALLHRPDAIVSDLEMPHMDGIELMRALRSNPKTKAIPVVIMTSGTAVDRVNACHSMGCSGFVLKPVQPEYLRAKLSALFVR